MNLQELTSYIHEHIPLTKELGAIIEDYNGDDIIISAPLEPNLNHRNTAFGGSLSTLGILSGWALLFIKIREENLKARLVIQHSSFNFTKPVEGDFVAICNTPDEKEWTTFLKTLRKFGKARIQMDSKIMCNDIQGGHHQGNYVAILLD